MADLMNMQPDEYKLLGKNFAPGRPYGIKSVTWHHMAGDLDADGCNRVWEKSGAAAHYSCDRNGWIVQHVHDMDRAYACGDGVGRGSAGNDKSVSIEVANDAAGPWTVHERALEACARLTAALCRFYGLGRPEWMVNVFPHRHYSATACPGELAGSQNAHAMERAQHWYDEMTGSAPHEPQAPAQPQPAPQPSGIAVDGLWGDGTTRALQRHFGTPEDGVVSSQSSAWRASNPGLTTGWEWVAGPRGSRLVAAIQRAVGVTPDGLIGPDTINGIIRRFKAESGATVEDGKLDLNSPTVKAMQRALNEGHF